MYDLHQQNLIIEWKDILKIILWRYYGYKVGHIVFSNVPTSHALFDIENKMLETAMSNITL